MSRIGYSVCILLSLVPFGCGSDFAPASRIEGLRLLAVSADHPSATPGQEVMLEALYHDTKGRTLSWGFAFCDSQTSSAAVDCLRALDMASLTIRKEAPQHVFTMPSAPDEVERDSAVGIAVIACPGEIVPGDTNGIPLACESNGRQLPIDEFEVGVKRVFFAAEEENQNPALRELLWDGEPWPAQEVKQVRACSTDSDDIDKCAAELRHTIKVVAEGAAETFTDTRGVEATEQAVVQFYATGGSFEWSARVPESANTRWAARKKDRGETLQLFFVVRDSRGGVSWQTRQVEVSPD